MTFATNMCAILNPVLISLVTGVTAPEFLERTDVTIKYIRVDWMSIVFSAYTCTTCTVSYIQLDTI